MKLKINGKEQIIETVRSLAELAESKKLNFDHIVMELNLEIIPKDQWDNVILQENDIVEIISFVGGG